MQDKYAIVHQLLQGLNEIAKLGTHYDLHMRNMLIRRVDEGKIDCVITDFEFFCPLGKDTNTDFSDIRFAAPEWAYGNDQSLAQEYDVWRMGLNFYEIFSSQKLPISKFREERREFLKNLKSGWLDVTNIPPKIGELVTLMTEPNKTKRIRAQDALEFFSLHCLK